MSSSRILAFIVALGLARPGGSVPRPLEGGGPEEPPVAGSAAAPPPRPAEPLNVTVQGEIKGQVPLERIRPPIETLFKDLVGLSRSGKTDRVLKESVGYLDLQEQMKLLKLSSRLVKQGAVGKLPTVPFFVVRVPAELWAGASRAEFQVLDSANRVLKVRELEPNQALATWDGYDESGEFLLETRRVYLPLFKVTRPGGEIDTIAGSGVRFDGLRYRTGPDLVMEVYNGSLYPEDLAAFSDGAAPFLREIFDAIRVNRDRPVEVVIFEEPRYMGLARERVSLWKERLARELLEVPGIFTVVEERGALRGTITRIRIPGAATP